MATQPPHCPQICPYGLRAGWQKQAGVCDGMEGDSFRSRDGEELSATRTVLA